MESVEQLPNNLKMLQSDSQFKLCTDSIALAGFPRLAGVKRVCDLGCGAGAVSLLLCGRAEGFTIDGLEPNEQALGLLRRNIALNSLEDRINAVPGRVGDVQSLLPAGKYDLAVSNPPYFAPDSGALNDSSDLAAARHSDISSFCRAASRLLRTGGRFCLVFRTERLARLCACLCENGLEPKRLRFIQHSASHAPRLFLLEALRGGGEGLSLEPPLILNPQKKTEGF